MNRLEELNSTTYSTIAEYRYDQESQEYRNNPAVREACDNKLARSWENVQGKGDHKIIYPSMQPTMVTLSMGSEPEPTPQAADGFDDRGVRHEKVGGTNRVIFRT